MACQSTDGYLANLPAAPARPAPGTRGPAAPDQRKRPRPAAGPRPSDALGPPRQPCDHRTAVQMASSANAPMTRPDAALIRRTQLVVIRVRSTDTTVVKRIHHAPDPSNTPRVPRAASPGEPPVTSRPANSAPKDRIVIGLVRVSPRIERYAPPRPPRRAGRAVAG